MTALSRAPQDSIRADAGWRHAASASHTGQNCRPQQQSARTVPHTDRDMRTVGLPIAKLKGQAGNNAAGDGLPGGCAQCLKTARHNGGAAYSKRERVLRDKSKAFAG